MRIAVFQIYDWRLIKFADEYPDGKGCFGLIELVNRYCKKFNYDHLVHYISEDYKNNPEFKRFSNSPFTDKPITDLYSMQHTKFYSFGTILEHFEKNEYDYICMIDVDIAIHDYNFSIEEYIKTVNAEEKSLVVGLECVDYKTYFDGRFPNGGVYLFKNTPWTRRFLLGMIKAITIIQHGSLRLQDCCQEQMQLAFAAMVCPDCDREMLITAGDTSIQNLFMPWYYPNLAEAPYRKHLFIHFTGSHKKSIVRYLEMIRDSGSDKNMDLNINIDNYLKTHENISIKHL